MAVSETWQNDLNSHLIYIPGYCKVSSMRWCGAKGGGTALFVQPNFKFTVIDVTTVSFESLFIETMDLDQKVKTIIGTIYRRQALIYVSLILTLKKLLGFLQNQK